MLTWIGIGEVGYTSALFMMLLTLNLEFNPEGCMISCCFFQHEGHAALILKNSGLEM